MYIESFTSSPLSASSIRTLKRKQEGIHDIVIAPPIHDGIGIQDSNILTCFNHIIKKKDQPKIVISIINKKRKTGSRPLAVNNTLSGELIVLAEFLDKHSKFIDKHYSLMQLLIK